MTLDSCDLATYDELAALIEQMPILIREKRRRNRLSLRAAGRCVGVSASTLMRFESGDHTGATDILVRLVRWLGSPDAPTS